MSKTEQIVSDLKQTLDSPNLKPEMRKMLDKKLKTIESNEPINKK